MARHFCLYLREKKNRLLAGFDILRRAVDFPDNLRLGNPTRRSRFPPHPIVSRSEEERYANVNCRGNGFWLRT
jgi:hypothetical protein